MIMKVARLGHPVIRTEAREVTMQEIPTPAFQRLLDDMVETMREYNGVGLAAPQVHVSLTLAVIEVEHNLRYPEAPIVPLTFLINPRIEARSPETVDGWEGCLSIPEMRGLVPRWREIHVQALGRKGQPLDFVARDFHARVIQHECDHLKGEVYLDRMRDLRSLAHLAEWQRFVVEPSDREATRK